MQAPTSPSPSSSPDSIVFIDQVNQKQIIIPIIGQDTYLVDINYQQRRVFIYISQAANQRLNLIGNPSILINYAPGQLEEGAVTPLREALANSAQWHWSEAFLGEREVFTNLEAITQISLSRFIFHTKADEEGEPGQWMDFTKRVPAEQQVAEQNRLLEATQRYHEERAIKRLHLIEKPE